MLVAAIIEYMKCIVHTYMEYMNIVGKELELGDIDPVY